MKNRLLKQLFCLLFVFLHLHVFASEISKNQSWTTLSAVNKINIYDFLPTVLNSNNLIATNDLELNVSVTNSCVTASDTSHTYTFTVTNVGDNSVSLSADNQIAVNFDRADGAVGEFSFEGIGLSGTHQNWDWSRTVLYNYTFNYPTSGVVELLPGQKIEFSISRNYNISAGDVRVIEANLSFTDDPNSDNNSSTALISRAHNTPGNKSFSLDYNTNSSIANLAGITSDINNYKFYVDGVEVSSDYVLNSTNSEIFNKTYTYSQLNNGCESPTSTIDIGPKPGLITADNLQVCFNGSVNITNAADGEGGYVTTDGARYALKYSFEVSYDNGITWAAPLDSSSDDSDGAKAVVVNNITSNVLIRRKAHERSTAAREHKYSYSNVVAISVIKNTIVFPTGTTNVIAKRVESGQMSANVQLPQVSATLSNSTFKYYQQNMTADGMERVEANPLTTFSLPVGEHLFEVVATNTLDSGASCTTSELIKVIVYDTSDCYAYTKRIFATSFKDWTSGASWVEDEARATNGNRAEGAALNGGVVLLGIGTVGVDLYFVKPGTNTFYTGEELKGKKVVIKLGEQYSGLKVAGGISVIGRLTDADTTPQNIALLNASNVGATFGVKGGVLDALKGDNVFEYSFVPASSIGSDGEPIPFNGVRIQLGSLLGVADLATVFYAYIEEEGSIENAENDNAADITNAQYCTLLNEEIKVTPPSSLLYPTSQDNSEGIEISGIANEDIVLNRSVEDAFWGNYSEVLNVGSALNSVVYPYYAVDDNYDSYSLFSTTVGVLNAQFLQAKLRQPARLGDQVQITLSYPNISILNLSLLQFGNFKIVYYLDGAKVGEEKLEEFRVLDAGLFRFRDKRRVVLSKPVNFMFDKVELFQFGTVNVNLGESLRVHDIRVNPLLAFDSQIDPKDVTPLCIASPLVIEKPDACTDYEISFARVTQFGPENYTITENDENNNPITRDVLDYKGNKIYPIEEIVDLTPDELSAVGVQSPTFRSTNLDDQFKAYFNINFTKLFVGEKYDGKLLIKIQAIRQGCSYGEPQYLRVDLNNCNRAIVNPVIKNVSSYQ